MTTQGKPRVCLHLHPVLKDRPKDYAGTTEAHYMIGKEHPMTLAALMYAAVIEVSEFYYQTGLATGAEINEQLGKLADGVNALKGSFKGGE